MTGEPWVKPEDALKKYVWSETSIEGGETFQGKLSQPSGQTGKYQDAHLEGRYHLGCIGHPSSVIQPVKQRKSGLIAVNHIKKGESLNPQ